METCGNCGTRVIPTAEGTCPSCRKPFVSTPANPFGEKGAAQNPYASLAGSQAIPSRDNPLFVPALILLVVSVFWVLYILAACAMVFSPDGPFSRMSPMIRNSSAVSYLLMLLVNVVFIAGAIAMLRMRPKWLAWTGCILGLVPMFGPCMGLTIPLAIWCLILLRRPNVDAQFPV